jgi:hypothetical protein
MIADYYLEGFDKEHKYSEEVVVSPKTCLFIPMKGNLRAKIEAERKLEMSLYKGLMGDERGVPALFWDGNLVLDKGGTYVFETRYVSDSDDVLPFSYLGTLPNRVRKKFLKKVPQEIHELANKLTGNERNSIKILRKFYEFVREHQKPESPTIGKPIKQLLKEYDDDGFFYGNCKEAKNFFMALCDAKGYPTKQVCGKSLQPGGHVWSDVFVPVNKGYKFLPVDAALGYFGNHNLTSHLFYETTPNNISIEPSLRIWDFVRRKKRPIDYKLSIEKID